MDTKKRLARLTRWVRALLVQRRLRLAGVPDLATVYAAQPRARRVVR